MAQNLQKGAFYLDSDIYNCPSDGFQRSLLKGHVGYQYQKYGYLGDSRSEERRVGKEGRSRW